jgi:hypothetical protein
LVHAKQSLFILEEAYQTTEGLVQQAVYCKAGGGIYFIIDILLS